MLILVSWSLFSVFLTLKTSVLDYFIIIIELTNLGQFHFMEIIMASTSHFSQSLFWGFENFQIHRYFTYLAIFLIIQRKKTKVWKLKKKFKLMKMEMKSSQKVEVKRKKMLKILMRLGMLRILRILRTLSTLRMKIMIQMRMKMRMMI